MRYQNLDLNLLVALDALIEHRNVSAAARQLCLTQPTVSGALKRLREFFRDELLVPMGREMALTPKAEELAAPVRETLMLVGSRIITAGTFDPVTANRKFTVAVSDYTFNVFLADVIAGIAGTAPGLVFDVVSINRTSAEKFARGEIDILISVSPYLLEDQPHEALFEDEEAVICWSGGIHRNGIDLETFFKSGHVAAFFGSEGNPALTDSFFINRRMSRRIEVRVPGFSSLPQAVVGSNRLAIMHRRHAELFAKVMPITVHDCPLPMPRLIEEMQWHSMRAQDPGLRWLLERLRRTAGHLFAARRRPADDNMLELSPVA